MLLIAHNPYLLIHKKPANRYNYPIATQQTIGDMEIQSDWAAQLASPLDISASLGECDSRDYEHTLQQAATKEPEIAFGNFSIQCGVSEFGNVTFYIRNGAHNENHCIINTPFTLDEWIVRTRD
jgi:hypothetical protein